MGQKGQSPGFIVQLKQAIAPVKPYLKWVIFGGTLFFLAATLKQHWQEVAKIRISGMGWAYMGLALAITLLAHVWSGWVWSWILQELGQPAKAGWGVRVYLKTNIAKYLPGNVWHFYGRVMGSKAAGFSLEAATLSILLEPLLMAASALMVALVGTQQANPGLKIFSLAVILMGVHPRVLNPLVRLAGRLKGKVKSDSAADTIVQVKRYPLVPLLGELVFLILRGAGFLAIMLMFNMGESLPILPLISAFSFSWLLGLVIPGAPGGIGVFEATMIALLGRQVPIGILLSAVALYRLTSTLAEASGAGLAYLYERWSSKPV
ncbi:MAG TPA: YbhN family protein [Chroococcidiopsis sp.]